MTQRPVYLIAVAGGRGSRMGAEIPKQFLPLAGVPVLERTISVFVRAIPDIHVVTVLPSDQIPYWKHLCLERNFTVTQTLVKGGFTRFHSVKTALARVPDDAIVFIHDGVRPLISADAIESMLSRMLSSDLTSGLIPVLPSVDSLRSLVKGEDGQLQLSDGPQPDRERVFRVQTPQVFPASLIKAAYTQPYTPAFTDDSSVAAQYEVPLSFCEGERYNIKLTTPEDLQLAVLLLCDR